MKIKEFSGEKKKQEKIKNQIQILILKKKVQNKKYIWHPK